jgi:hypothetical protein
LGIEVKIGYNTILLFEDEINFKHKKETLDSRTSYLKFSEYSFDEFKKAAHFHIELSQQQGYPKPENKYEEIFYEAKYRNEKESYLLIQKEDISASGISKSIKGFFGINTLFFEVFSDKNTYENLLKPLGIKSRKVLNGTRKNEIENIVQLIPQGVSLENFSNKFKEEKIGNKYRIISDYHEAFQGYTNKNTYDFFETKELFGFKEYTYRFPMISRKLYEILKNNKVKGCRYFPVIPH